MRPHSSAIIVGAGRGTRFGASDKVLLPINGRPVIAYSLDAAQTAEAIDEIILVVGEHVYDAITALTATHQWPKVHAITLGGDRRQDSVAAGVAAVSSASSYVAIHDAARPLVEASFFNQSIAQAQTSGAAIVAVPVADTLKRVEHQTIVATISRDGLWAAQTPQAFDIAKLKTAFAAAEARGLDVTDEASLFESLGFPVAIVPGSATNVKLTHPPDLALIGALLAIREHQSK